MEGFDPKALHNIDYGMYVVTAAYSEKKNGQIANTVIQLSSDPYMVGVCVNRKNLTHDLIDKSGHFAVSVLDQETPMRFIGVFGFKSGRDLDKFEGINFDLGATGCPLVIDNALSVFEVKVIGKMDIATHTMFVGKVVSGKVLKQGTTLTYSYYHHVKKGKSPKNAPTYQAPIEEKVDSVDSGKKKYVCDICGYVYDPDAGDPENQIAPGTTFKDVPDDWACPVCGAGKDKFSPA